MFPCWYGMPTWALFRSNVMLSKFFVIPVAETTKKAHLLNILRRQMPSGTLHNTKINFSTTFRGSSVVASKSRTATIHKLVRDTLKVLEKASNNGSRSFTWFKQRKTSVAHNGRVMEILQQKTYGSRWWHIGLPTLSVSPTNRWCNEQIVKDDIGMVGARIFRAMIVWKISWSIVW